MGKHPAKRGPEVWAEPEVSMPLVAQEKEDSAWKQMGGGDAKEERDERGICVDLRPIRVEVWQQTAKFRKAIILQFKKN